MRYRNMKQNVKLFVYNHLLHLIPSVELLGKLEWQKKNESWSSLLFSAVRNYWLIIKGLFLKYLYMLLLTEKGKLNTALHFDISLFFYNGSVKVLFFLSSNHMEWKTGSRNLHYLCVDCVCLFLKMTYLN
jgi:hypothetical protein